MAGRQLILEEPVGGEFSISLFQYYGCNLHGCALFDAVADTDNVYELIGEFRMSGCRSFVGRYALVD